jgi:DNA processing protein
MALSSISLLRLHRVPGIGQRTLQKIMTWAGGSDERLSELFDLAPGEIGPLFGLKDEVAAALKNSTADQGAALASELAQHGWQLVTWQDPVYPASLRARLGDHAPVLLYVSGNAEGLAHASVAFSGSRHVSEQGMRHTAMLAEDAVRQQFSVVSGHAPGVDVVAHRTALEHGGLTVIVSPEGALQFKLRPELQVQPPQQVIVVSEFPPQIPWSAANAMIRNKTIIGLSQALCVIEAGATGGTLKAGEEALALRVPVFVLDYPDPPPSAEGNKILLGKGAHPIPITPRMVLPDLNVTVPPASPENPRQLSLFGE